jgi:hypothetical protein
MHLRADCADDIPYEQDGWRENEEWRGGIEALQCLRFSKPPYPVTDLAG